MSRACSEIGRRSNRLRTEVGVSADAHGDSAEDRLETQLGEIMKGLLRQATKCDLYPEGKGVTTEGF